MEKIENEIKDSITVTLDTPIQRGEQVISEITIRKFTTGALRGIKLNALMDLDVDAYTTLLPRISEPMLSVAEIRNMDPADLIKLSGEAVYFLLPKSEKLNSQKI